MNANLLHKIRVATGTAVALIFSILFIVLAYSNEKEKIVYSNSKYAQTTAAYTSHALGDYNLFLSNSAAKYITANRLEKDAIEAILHGRVDGDITIESITIYDPNGNTIFETDATTDFDIKPLLQTIIKKGIYTSEAFKYRDKWFFNFYKHIRDKDNKTVGFAVATIDIARLSGQFSPQNSKPEGVGGISLVSGSGNFMARSPFVETMIGFKSSIMKNHPESIKKSESFLVEKSLLGDNRYTSVVPVAGYDLAVISTVSDKLLYENLKHPFMIIAIFFIIFETLLITLSTKLRNLQQAQELTAEKERERIKESEERFKYATKLTGQMVVEYFPDKQTFFWSGACKKVTGYSCDELNSFDLKRSTEIFHKEDQKSAVDFLKNPDPIGKRYRVAHKDGVCITVDVHGGFFDSNRLIIAIRSVGVTQEQDPSLLE